MFSEMIDQIIEETARRDRINLIVASANDILRHIHKSFDWDEDLAETSLTPLPGEAMLPQPTMWKKDRLVRSIRAIRLNGHCFAEEVRPGARQENRQHFWYQAGDCVAIRGGCSQIDIAYYRWNRHFQYYPLGKRPAVWDNEAQSWTFLTPTGYVATLGSVDDEATALSFVFDWPMDELRYIWYHGILARVYTAIGERDRAAPFYTLFTTELRDHLGSRMAMRLAQ